MSWIEKIFNKGSLNANRKADIPQGVWTKCPSCTQVLYRTELERNLEVCPKCQHHMRISARERLNSFLDPSEEVLELGADIEPKDVLKFKDIKKYKDRLAAAQKETNEKDALVVVRGTLMGIPVVAAAFEFSFMGGSMGSVVGARFIKAVERALEDKIPLICFSTSGGARMQESLLALMQMARTSAALGKMREQKLPYISVMTDPTMGGVSASLAMLGDINIAEPKALIGFAGPRVIEQTVREKLPEGFQRSEFLLEKGAIDMIVSRNNMRKCIADLLAMLTKAPLISTDLNVNVSEDLTSPVEEVVLDEDIDTELENEQADFNAEELQEIKDEHTEDTIAPEATESLEEVIEEIATIATEEETSKLSKKEKKKKTNK